MSNSIESQMADFFRKQYESRPAVRQKIKGPRVWGEDFRAEIFAKAHQPRLRTRAPWDGLSGTIYELWSSSVSVVLAVYSDGTILWLDDHSDDSDFVEFIRREHLLEWVPDRLDEFLVLLVEGKLNYLGWIRLIGSVSDIPPLPVEIRNWYTNPEKWKGSTTEFERAQQFVLELDKRLAAVADQIKPPACSISNEGEIQLSFYVWTKWLGKVIRFNCFLTPDYGFRLDGVELVEEVGFSIAPR